MSSLPGPEPRTKRPASSQDLKGGESTRSVTTTGKTIKPVSAVRSLTSLTSKCVTPLSFTPRNQEPDYYRTDATTRDDDAHDVSDREGALRSSRTTEAERRSYLESHPDVAELEPHRVKCRCCDKWLKLSSTQNYALAPWKLHKKACTPEYVADVFPVRLQCLYSVFLGIRVQGSPVVVWAMRTCPLLTVRRMTMRRPSLHRSPALM